MVKYIYIETPLKIKLKKTLISSSPQATPVTPPFALAPRHWCLYPNGHRIPGFFQDESWKFTSGEKQIQVPHRIVLFLRILPGWIMMNHDEPVNGMGFSMVFLKPKWRPWLVEATAATTAPGHDEVNHVFVVDLGLKGPRWRWCLGRQKPMTLWLWLTVRHGIDGPNRNRWFS